MQLNSPAKKKKKNVYELHTWGREGRVKRTWQAMNLDEDSTIGPC